MIDFSKKPFSLRKRQIETIRQQLTELSLDEKIGQLFCVMVSEGLTPNPTAMIAKYQIGSLMLRTSSPAWIQATLAQCQQQSPLPLLVAANLESGAQTAVSTGTPVQSQMGIAATGKVEQAYRLAQIACSEAAANGLNWTFSPVVDLDLNDHNPITNTRTYGSQVQRVSELSRQYLLGALDAGVIPTIKHFPGDGVDERDQHLVTSVNQLSAGDWFQTYGQVYQNLIDTGAPVVMVGHIAQPALVRHFEISADEAQQYLPASLSSVLIKKVLRQHLGFNGVVVSDASQMLGFTTAMPRSQAVPQAIQSGCDLLLFPKNLAEDRQFIKDGLAKGILTQRRLDEAVLNILALKMTLQNAPQDKRPSTSQVTQWVEAIAADSITKVKDPQNQLPLRAQKTPRILLNVYTNDEAQIERLNQLIEPLLTQAGFSVTLRASRLKQPLSKLMKTEPAVVRQLLSEMTEPVAKFKAQYDVALLVIDVQNRSGEVTSRLQYSLLGNEAPWYSAEIPTVCLSLGNPYHLRDLPQGVAYVNAYSDFTAVVQAALACLTGQAPFKGYSPVDAFCGLTTTHF